MNHYHLPSIHNFSSTINEKNTHLIVLKNTRGMQVALSDYGARIVSILVPDNKGNLIDVALGFGSIHRYYYADEQYHGVTAGRFANRIANGKFELNGKEFSLPINNGINCLHGGPNGFHKKIWDRRVSYESQAEFYLISADGEEGFPGNLNVSVSYTLTNENEIIIKYRADSDQDTVINLTNHTYFNLNGEGSGDILSHQLRIHADAYLAVDDYQIPCARVPVAGTAFDFQEFKSIAQDIIAPDEQLISAKGYDHCYIHNNPISQACATVYSPSSGVRLDVFTTEPGVQLYTGNWMTGNDIGKSGNTYLPYAGFCLETQHFPDSPNQPEFPSTLLKTGEEFISETHYKFSIEK
ncbi:galactose mutarotase [Sphingobacterium sp. SRCM116780]|uniref:aldose epimerase family protein n=1 Tax=Sphingobacterium sp. SRCM116780 TaxID=2907623 RepID=UPI001F3E152A|nr:aldose epimerase family protein [Sphingobacterium sp. SRCM116780]UIR55367.1 galactose mutarotase [Sphingobacterium sp. SRCM116780]